MNSEQSLTDADMAPLDLGLQLNMTDLLVDAIDGVGLPTFAIALAAEKEHMAHFSGDQHNPSWRWHKYKLAKLPEAKLQALYYNLKVAQNGG